MSARPTRSRSSFSTTSVLFVTAGDHRLATGGNLYARHMLAALRRSGIRVVTLSTDHPPATAALRKMHPEIAIIDTIAASAAAPIISALRANGARIVTLALMSRGAARLARDSDRVIAVSMALARELRAAGIPRSRVETIAPGTVRTAKSRVTASQIARARSGAGGVRVLCVANWTPAKGIHTLLDAARSVPGVLLDLVGAQPDAAYAKRVREQIARPELAGRVRVHGAVRGARLERLYRAATIFALPSTLESYGMAVSDALAHGLPVIACELPATREVAGSAALLVPPRRVGPLARALRSLATDQRRRNALSRRARTRVSTLPTWPQSERRFVRTLLRRTSSERSRSRW